VHRYISMYPQSISKALAHGYAIGMTDFDYTFFRILSQNTVLQIFLKNHPEDKIRLKKLNEFLADQKTCFSNGGEEYCGYEISMALVGLLGFQNNWPTLHTWILNMVPKDRVLESGVQTFVSRHMKHGVTYHNYKGINDTSFTNQIIALNLFGVIDSNTTPIDTDKCAKIYARLETNYKLKKSDLLLNECQAPMQFGFKDSMNDILRSKVNTQQIRYVELRDVQAKLLQFKIPFNLYSGSLDAYLPKELFKLEVTTLGSSVKYFNFSRSGHEGFSIENQVFLDLAL
jgi:hypothetical protein